MRGYKLPENGQNCTGKNT